MKTPHRITLIREGGQSSYNPETDRYEEVTGQETVVPCLVNFVSQAKVFAEYGSHQEKVMICRFEQAQEPFSAAIFDGGRYEPLDQIDAPIKGAVRLKKVGG